MAKDFVPVNLSNPIFGYTRYTYHYAWCTTEQSTHTHICSPLFDVLLLQAARVKAFFCFQVVFDLVTRMIKERLF